MLLRQYWKNDIVGSDTAGTAAQRMGVAMCLVKSPRVSVKRACALHSGHGSLASFDACRPDFRLIALSRGGEHTPSNERFRAYASLHRRELLEPNSRRACANPSVPTSVRGYEGDAAAARPSLGVPIARDNVSH